MTENSDEIHWLTFLELKVDLNPELGKEFLQDEQRQARGAAWCPVAAAKR